MPRKISDSVVIITGASSGIGRAAALAFAARGGSVVVAARREQPLHEVVLQCENLGGRALAVPTDVTDERAVQNLARQAIERFGRIDVWINNAAVALFGRFEETPADVYRRVIEVKLFGYIYGARAALPYFREQGSGILINNASMVGRLSEPYVSAYVAANHGIRGWAMSLRQELSLDGDHNIHICTVLPAMIDTPFLQHAGNYTGRALQAMPPVYSPEQVADTFLRLAEHPQRERFVGNSGRMMAFQSTLAPGWTERQLAVMTEKTHLSREKPAPPGPGNILEPMSEWTSVRGGWKIDGRWTLGRAAFTGLAAVLPILLARRYWPEIKTSLPGGNHHSERMLRLLKPAVGALGEALLSRYSRYSLLHK